MARFKAAAAGDVSDGYRELPDGEILGSPGVEVCVACHNPGSPNYEPFCYFEMRAKIDHRNPKKPRTEEEQAAYGKCPCGSPCPHAEGCPEGLCNLTPAKMQGQ